MTQRLSRGAVLVALVALAARSPVAAQEQYRIAGGEAAIYNLAGEIVLAGGGGGDLVVEVRRGGGDAGDLDVRVDRIDGRPTLRVLYPSDRIHYDPRGWGGNTELRVLDDGTWGRGGGGDRVRVSDGGGLDAHADLRVTVPRGQRLDIYLAAGRITAENVDGRIRLDTHSGGVTARGMAGSLLVDTGSGAVDVREMEGDLIVDTGSGSVQVADVTGESVAIDTGSGSVQAEGVRAREIEIDTGSGRIRLASSAAPDVRLDTGSGSVEAHLTDDVDRLVVDTGSGSVTVRLPENLGAELDVETGSGGIEVDFPVMVTRRARDELHGAIGDGRGSIRIDTGSGGIRILKG